MTIQEAIKSGKPFGRKDWGTLKVKVGGRAGFIVWTDTLENLIMNKQDILATDWEIKQ